MWESEVKEQGEPVQVMRGTKAGRTAMVSMFAILSLVAACGTAPTRSSDRVAFDGQYFRASAKPVDKRKAPAEFRVTVSGASASLDGAREAGRFEGTKFCVQNFGASRIVWSVGPDTEPQNLRIVDDKLTFAGTCLRP